MFTGILQENCQIPVNRRKLILEVYGYFEKSFQNTRNHKKPYVYDYGYFEKRT